MKKILKVLSIVVILLGLYYVFTLLQDLKRMRSIEKQYPALQSDYSESVIASRAGSWMVWDIREKGVTINAGSVFDDESASKNLSKVCNPTEIIYKGGISIFDCGDFYGIFILGNPPNPTLYGPFNK